MTAERWVHAENGALCAHGVAAGQDHASGRRYCMDGQRVAKPGYAKHPEQPHSSDGPSQCVTCFLMAGEGRREAQHAEEGHVCSWACPSSDPAGDIRELWERETMWAPPEPPSSYGIPQAPPPFRPQYLGERYDPPAQGWRFEAGPGYLFTGPLGDGRRRSKWKARWWLVTRALPRRFWRRSER